MEDPPALGAQQANAELLVEIREIHKTSRRTYDERITGERIECAQAGQAAAAQDPVDRVGPNIELAGQPVLASTVLDAGGDDTLFHLV